MGKNNLLLGNGQALVSATEWVTAGRTKRDVYSIEEARAHLHPQLELFARSAVSVPSGASPRGEVVGKVLVHPEYLAKSHFPARALREAGLRIVGTRSKEIQPRRRLRKTNPDDPMLTAEIMVAGSLNQFGQLDALLMRSGQVGIRRDFSRMEEISFMSPGDRIRRMVPLSDGSVLLEAVLHADGLDDDIVTAFAMWAEQCGGRVDLRKTINVDSLTFVPVWLSLNDVPRLAQFSHVRVLRSASALRSLNGALRGSLGTVFQVDPLVPISQDIRVAIFDGGLDAKGIDDCASEHLWPETTKTSADFIDHGAMVTSAVLFGPVADGQESLPRPYTHVDHFRIATPHDEKDPEMFDAVARICQVLDRGEHDYANISLAPADPLSDDDVHLWTSVLEKRLASRKMLLTVATGNDGHLPFPNSRIQVPSDLVNAVAVGASTSADGALVRWNQSCIGPGRSPGLIKPDGVAWGDAVPLFNPRDGHVYEAKGTSFAAPLALRTAVGAAAMADGISPGMARALLIHHTERPRGSSRDETGHGRFSLDAFDLITCGDKEASVTYEGELTPGRPIGARLPWPEDPVLGSVRIRATLLFYTPVDVAHPINYTRSGIEARLRRSPGGDTVSFFSKAKLFANSEQQLRADAHKWETVLSKEIGAQAVTLNDPMLELVYRAREEGMAVNNAKLEPLHYVLVVTVSANGEPDFYDRVRRRYPVLMPVRLRMGVSLPAV